MRDAVSVYGRAIVDLYEEWFSLIGANLVCFVCFIPGLMVLLGLLGVVLQRPETEQLWVLLPPITAIAVLAGGPALAGVHNLTNPISHEKRIDFAYFWEGFRYYYLKSWQILGLWVVVAATLAANVWFYRMWWQRGTQIALLPVVLFLWILVLWVGIEPYLFPLLLEQDDKRVLLVFKNAILLCLANPGFTVLVMALLGATMLLSLVFPPLLMLTTFSLMALVNNRAIVQLRIRLEEQRERYGLSEEGQLDDETQGGEED
jgi:uncharacterized membrane protein YesL